MTTHPNGATEFTGAIFREPAVQQRKRQKAIQRISKLRRKASDEIERLMAFLDASDPYAATELEQAVDDAPCDGDPDAEPSLGSFDRMSDQVKAWSTRSNYTEIEVDAEHDTADAEPSLGATAVDQHVSQERWAQGERDDREGDGCADDREPDVDDEPNGDNEPALGWNDEEAALGRYSSQLGRS